MSSFEELSVQVRAQTKIVITVCPKPQSDDIYRIGRDVNTGSQTYQIKLLINGIKVVTWDPFITAI